jgi:hypothetical protein
VKLNKFDSFEPISQFILTGSYGATKSDEKRWISRLRCITEASLDGNEVLVTNDSREVSTKSIIIIFKSSLLREKKRNQELELSSISIESKFARHFSFEYDAWNAVFATNTNDRPSVFCGEIGVFFFFGAG